MANYFNYYPKVVYDLGNKNSLDIIVNLTTNFSFINNLIDNTSAYYEYTVADGDTPEIIAYKVYGDAFYHWIILRFNNIMDIKTQWPLDYNSLTESIESNYVQYASVGQTGLEWAMSNYQSYYRIETKTYVDYIDTVVEKYQIDAATYAALSPSTTQITLPSNVFLSLVIAKFITTFDGNVICVVMNLAITKDRKTFYDYELEQNEQKRTIKILKSEFVNPVKEEFVRIMTNE